MEEICIVGSFVIFFSSSMIMRRGRQPEKMRPPGRYRNGLEDNIEMGLQ
jgi:hypothetical protein